MMVQDSKNSAVSETDPLRWGAGFRRFSLVAGAVMLLLFAYVIFCMWFPVSRGTPMPGAEKYLWDGGFVELLLYALQYVAPIPLAMLLYCALQAHGSSWKYLLLLPIWAFPYYQAPIVRESLWAIRHREFTALAQRAQPLVQAIKHYTKDHKGAPPSTLSALVPLYLPKVPGTEIRAFPKYKYRLLGEDNRAWELKVPCTLGGLNWDEFYYWPSEQYPPELEGSLDHIDGWVYFHE